MNQVRKHATTKVALAALAFAASVLPGVAKADAYSQAVLNITNFQFSFNTATVQLNSGGPTLDASSRWLGVAGTSFDGVKSVAGPDGGLYTPTPAAGFTGLVMPGNFAGGSVSLSGTGLPAGSPPFPAVNDPATARVDAAVSVTPAGGTPGAPNSSNGEINLSQRYTLTALGDTQLGLSFTAYQFIRNYLNSGTDPFVNGQAQASTQWTMSIVCTADIVGFCEQDDSVFDWEPNTGAGGGASGVAVVSASGDYDMNVTRTLNGPGDQGLPGGLKERTGSFAALTALKAGTYEISITHKTGAAARIEIPEPATLGLLGIAALGAAAASRRRAKQA